MASASPKRLATPRPKPKPARPWATHSRSIMPGDVPGRIAEAVEQANAFDVSGRTPASNTRGDESGLTAREREVLALIAAGCSDREIAERLFISRHTATTHVGNILLKLDVTTRAAAAARAVQAGYVDGPW